MPKQARARTWIIKPGSDGRKWSQWPQGDKPGGAGYSIDFTAATIEDPLSAGGIWTNNTQGTGGNAAMGTQMSMRVALASNGTTKICQHASSAVSSYDDPFAFVPGISGNQRVTATIYRGAGYAPSNNHEIEIILGCVVYGNNNRRWVECLWGSAAGQVDIVLLDGANNGFTIIGTVVASDPPADGDQFIAELDRSAQTIKWWKNAQLQAQIDWTVPNGNIDATVQSKLDSLGDGAGLASYRVAGGSTDSTALGFRSFLVETF